ncbi:hypothetical protein FG386_001808 [Cryptosporidium ryanae]|uniref:uncharacterized protein n=1 Tax=Cryptosporidium ryanae TaxID=515981 RepID=UPI00351A5CFF|nr:hypothetical protein FG386_001808 [Cryptosporidium ryanae]
MIWKNKKFLIYGFKKEEANIIKLDYIEKYSGELITISDKSEVKENEIDYVICNYSDGYMHRIPNLDYNKLRTPFWLWLSVKDQWKYSLDWHPFFRPNGRFTYNLLSGIKFYILGFTPTIRGFGDKSPIFIRGIYDIGILTSFIETQMGGTVENIGEDIRKNLQLYREDSCSNNRSDKIVLVCSKVHNLEGDNYDGDENSYINNKNSTKLNTEINFENIIKEIKEKKENGYHILTMTWLFDCYEEGRLINYRNYIFRYEKEFDVNNLRNEDSIKENKKNDEVVTFKVVVTHQTYLNYCDIIKNITSGCEEERDLSIVIERPSKMVIKHMQESVDNSDKECIDYNKILILVFNDAMEEQEFWYDLLNSMTESIEFNMNLISNEKKSIIKNSIRKIRIISDPNEFFSCFDLKRKTESSKSELSFLLSCSGNKVGFSIPKFIEDLLKSETEILDTVLNITDFDSITGLSGFVEYADDESLDIIKYSKNKAVNKFNSIEEKFNMLNNKIPDSAI